MNLRRNVLSPQNHAQSAVAGGPALKSRSPYAGGHPQFLNRKEKAPKEPLPSVHESLIVEAIRPSSMPKTAILRAAAPGRAQRFDVIADPLLGGLHHSWVLEILAQSNVALKRRNQKRCRFIRVNLIPHQAAFLSFPQCFRHGVAPIFKNSCRSSAEALINA
jgi:hypothetical protein